MRAILDTNILVSALIASVGAPGFLYQLWRTGGFALLSCEEQFEEFRRVTRYPRLRKYLRPAAAGAMLNEIRVLAELAGPLPKVDVCADPADNFLRAMSEAGKADYLVTGDGRDLLNLERHGSTRIVTARQAVAILG